MHRLFLSIALAIAVWTCAPNPAMSQGIPIGNPGWVPVCTLSELHAGTCQSQVTGYTAAVTDGNPADSDRCTSGFTPGGTDEVTCRWIDGAWSEFEPGQGLPGSGIDSVAEDTTPQLGGDLDGQGNNIFNVGTVDGIDISGHAAAPAAHHRPTLYYYTADYAAGSTDSDGLVEAFRDCIDVGQGGKVWFDRDIRVSGSAFTLVVNELNNRNGCSGQGYGMNARMLRTDTGSHSGSLIIVDDSADLTLFDIGSDYGGGTFSDFNVLLKDANANSRCFRATSVAAPQINNVKCMTDHPVTGEGAGIGFEGFHVLKGSITNSHFERFATGISLDDASNNMKIDTVACREGDLCLHLKGTSGAIADVLTVTNFIAEGNKRCVLIDRNASFSVHFDGLRCEQTEGPIQERHGVRIESRSAHVKFTGGIIARPEDNPPYSGLVRVDDGGSGPFGMREGFGPDIAIGLNTRNGIDYSMSGSALKLEASQVMGPVRGNVHSGSGAWSADECRRRLQEQGVGAKGETCRDQNGNLWAVLYTDSPTGTVEGVVDSEFEVVLVSKPPRVKDFREVPSGHLNPSGLVAYESAFYDKSRNQHIACNDASDPVAFVVIDGSSGAVIQSFLRATLSDVLEGNAPYPGIVNPNTGVLYDSVSSILHVDETELCTRIDDDSFLMGNNVLSTTTCNPSPGGTDDIFGFYTVAFDDTAGEYRPATYEWGPSANCQDDTQATLAAHTVGNGANGATINGVPGGGRPFTMNPEGIVKTPTTGEIFITSQGGQPGYQDISLPINPPGIYQLEETNPQLFKGATGPTDPAQLNPVPVVTFESSAPRAFRPYFDPCSNEMWVLFYDIVHGNHWINVQIRRYSWGPEKELVGVHSLTEFLADGSSVGPNAVRSLSRDCDTGRTFLYSNSPTTSNRIFELEDIHVASAKKHHAGPQLAPLEEIRHTTGTLAAPKLLKPGEMKGQIHLIDVAGDGGIRLPGIASGMAGCFINSDRGGALAIDTTNGDGAFYLDGLYLPEGHYIHSSGPGVAACVAAVRTRAGSDELEWVLYSTSPDSVWVAQVDAFPTLRGIAVLGTAPIAANTCAAAVTVASDGAAVGDVVLIGSIGDQTGITGYGAAAGDGLGIFPYATEDNVHFPVCNVTGASITPGSRTINWRRLE